VKQSVAGETLKHQRVRGTGDRRNGFSLLEVLMVVGISTVVAAIAVPMMKNTIGDFKLSGDARGLTNAVSLAKLRAASDFSQSRLYVDRDARSYHVEVWAKTAVPPRSVLIGWVKIAMAVSMPDRPPTSASPARATVAAHGDQRHV